MSMPPMLAYTINAQHVPQGALYNYLAAHGAGRELHQHLRFQHIHHVGRTHVGRVDLPPGHA